MRSRRRLRFVGWALLIGVLAACGPLSAQPPPDMPPAYQPTGEPSPVPGVDAVPTLPQYRLEVSLDPDQKLLVGRQQVIVPNHGGGAWDEIVFRLYPNLPEYGGRLQIGQVWVDGKSTPSSQRADDTSLVVSLPRPLLPEKSVTVDLTFETEIPQREEGYSLFGYSQGIWSLPDAYPLLAVHDDTGWHEEIAPAHGDAVFAEVAHYDVSLTLPPDLIVAPSGTIVSDTPAAGEPGGQRTYRIVGGPLREFTWLASARYLVAETVAAYGATLRSFYLPGDDAAGQAALSIAAAALQAYEDTLGPYPFAEMAVVEAPLQYYGMEYPGLNLIGLDLYRDQRAELENRVVHEIAHQWWYAQVGNDPINTPWLDEGLAEYSMAIYYEKVFGEARMNTLINQRWLVPYQVAIENGYDAIVNQPAAAFSWEYEVIVYGKAALFFDALRQQVGDETFTAILRAYVERYRWQIARPDDLLQIAESVSGQELGGLYTHWILSK